MCRRRGSGFTGGHEAMGYGQWREERYLPAPADAVFETFLRHLEAHNYEVVQIDKGLRGVTVLPMANVRIAAAVDEAGDGQSRIILESGPAFAHASDSEPLHKKIVDNLITSIEETLGLPEQGARTRRALPAGPRSTGFGWREGRYLPATPETVREELLDWLTMLGYDVGPSKPGVSHVTAYSRSLAADLRIVAEIDGSGEGRSRVIIESEPAGLPNTDESLHQRIVEHLFAKIEESLSWRPDDLEPESVRDT